MAYTKTTWSNGGAPAINETNLNKIETGVDEAHDLVDLVAAGTINLGDPTADGSYRITIDGTSLNIERRESSAWVVKSYVTA